MNLFHFTRIVSISLGTLSPFVLGLPFSFVDILKDLFPSSDSPPTAFDGSLLPTLSYFAEYSAAAYCSGNHGSGKLTCPSDFCPTVSSNDVNAVAEFQDNGIIDTAGFVALDDTTKTIVVAFRGSRSIRNYLLDAFIVFKGVPQFCSNCEAHSGFFDGMNVQLPTILEAVNTLRTQNPSYSIVVTGHSLGGALAILAATALRKQGMKVTTYAYASPRVGNEQLSEFITNDGPNFRMTHLDDPIPRLPPLELGYRHISPEYHIVRGDFGIRPQDIEVLSGTINFGGNTGDDPLGFNISAHFHYLLKPEISGCGPTGISFKL